MLAADKKSSWCGGVGLKREAAEDKQEAVQQQ